MKHLHLTETLYQYLLDTSVREHPAQSALREKTAELPLAHMQIAPEQGQFMQLLIRIIQAKHVLEIGTYTGYSALTMALALPEDGHLITCDRRSEWVEIGYPFWLNAGVQHKITSKLGQALDTMQQLCDELGPHYFDFIFIDADKTNYLNYYELGLQLLRSGGLMVVDNVLWYGHVVNHDDNRPQTRAIRLLNNHIMTDNRIDASLLPIADGVFLVRKK